MTSIPNEGFVAEGFINANVANAGTFTVAYPAGSSQGAFLRGQGGPNSYIILNGNDRFDVGAGGIALTFGASDITVTNNTGATILAGTAFVLNLDVEDANDVVILTLPITLAAITGANDVVNNIRPGINGIIESVEFVVQQAVTTAGRAATLNLEINTTNVIGGTVALTSAAATPLGAVIAGSDITAANVITKADTLSVEAASVTAFAEGSGYLLVRIRRTGNYL